MKSSGPLPRYTALASTTPLRRTAMSPRSKRTNQKAWPKRSSGSGISPKVRAALAERSGGVCEVQADGCWGRAVDPSHRKTTGMGGRKGEAAVRHHVLSQLLHACRHCHETAIHAMPAVAFWAGWMLRENEIPAEVPVLYRGVWVRLADDGSIEPTNQTAEEA